MSKENKELLKEYRILQLLSQSAETTQKKALATRKSEISDKMWEEVESGEISASEFKEAVNLGVFTEQKLKKFRDSKVISKSMSATIVRSEDRKIPLNIMLNDINAKVTPQLGKSLKESVEEIVSLISGNNYNLMANALIQVIQENPGMASTIMCELLTRGYKVKDHDLELIIKNVHEMCRCEVTGEKYIPYARIDTKPGKEVGDLIKKYVMQVQDLSPQGKSQATATANTIKNYLIKQPHLVTKENVEQMFEFEILTKLDLMTLTHEMCSTQAFLDAEIILPQNSDLPQGFDGSVLEYLVSTGTQIFITDSTRMDIQEFVEKQFPGVYNFEAIKKIVDLKAKNPSQLQSDLEVFNDTQLQADTTINSLREQIENKLQNNKLTPYTLRTALFKGVINEEDLVKWAKKLWLTEELFNTKFNVQNLKNDSTIEPRVITLYQYLCEQGVTIETISSQITMQDWVKSQDFEILHSIKHEDKQLEAKKQLDHALDFIKKHPRMVKIILDKAATLKAEGRTVEKRNLLDYLTMSKYDSGIDFMEKGGKHLVTQHQKSASNIFARMWDSIANFCLIKHYGGKEKGIQTLIDKLDKHMALIGSDIDMLQDAIRITAESQERRENYKGSTVSEKLIESLLTESQETHIGSSIV